MARSAKPVRRDRSLRKFLALVTLLLAAGFAAAWGYQQYHQEQRLATRYTVLRPVAVGHSGHSISATFAIKTSAADARWAQQNRDGIEAALQQSLMGVDPQRVLAPGGLQAMQQNMHVALNGLLATDKVQQVIVTDFLVSEGDY